MKTRRIIISGPFTDKDIVQLVDTLRQIGEAHPHDVFTTQIIDTDSTMDEGEALLRRALPPVLERATVFARAAYRDDTFPGRCCDYCGQSYRGPAVYCSLECALADA